MGIASSKNNSESLNWDKINTESMSTTVPNLNNISKDAQDLISNLNINNNVDFENTESDNDNLFTWIKTIGEEKKDSREDNDTAATFSDTSAFISSDMYKYLMNKNTESATSNNQVGGGIQEDSSTSSTSSSPAKKNKNSRKNKKYTATSSSMSGGDLSYLSSSAHTEHSNSESHVIATENYESSSDSNLNTSISVGNNKMLTSSINTSDINLVSPNE